MATPKPRSRCRSEGRDAAIKALGHAENRLLPSALCVQREPFDENGERTDAFAMDGDARTPRGKLWNVELTFARPLPGPMLLGDGRFLGLGVMMPVGAGVGSKGMQTLTSRDDEDVSEKD